MGAAAPIDALRTESVPVPRHGSWSRPGADGFYRIHYCDWGRGDNPRVVVCVHGYHRSARDFDALARDLSSRFRVICPDLAGRGKSDWLGTATEHCFAQLLADLDGLLSGLGVDEVDWIGTSLGGILGMHLAVQAGTPIRRLVLKNVGECMPVQALPPAARPLSAPMAGVHSMDLWKRVKCPTVLLRGDAPPMSPGEVETIHGFLVQEAGEPRSEADSWVPA